MLVRLGRFGFHHPWRMILIWVVALFGVFGVVSAVGDDFDESFEIPGSEATRGLDVLDEHFEHVGAADQILLHGQHGYDGRVRADAGQRHS